MTIPSITALPTAPQRTDAPATFVTRADAFVAALSAFGTQANASIVGINNLAVAGTLSEVQDTSTSSIAIGTGEKVFTITAGKSFVAGMTVLIADSAAPSANALMGTITSYSGTTLTMAITSVIGSGTKTSWVMFQTSTGGATLTSNTFTGTQDFTGATVLGIDADPILGFANKSSWANNEQISIALDSPASAIAKAHVSIYEEVPQTGVTNNNWDAAAGSYTLEDSATATTLTPSATGNGTFTLGTGSFTSADVGKTITGNGGVSVLTTTDGAYVTSTAFTDTSAIASGDWSMYAVVYDAGTDVLEISGLIVPTTGFDVSLASFTDSFSVSAQGEPQDVAFNTDGTKMFIVASATVYEYALSTGFDASTSVYSQNFLVSSQETSPNGLAFNADGTKMFIVGLTGDDVNEYALTTGFDISTASFTDAFSISAQETSPSGVAFSTDGTKMFIVGYSGDDVNEYALSTGFDVSTASFTDSFSVSAQEIIPMGLDFNTDGSKMFIVGLAGDDVNEYALSTGFDVSTASFTDAFSVAAQDTGPRGVAFNTNGTKMFVAGSSSNTVYEYSVGSFVSPSGYQPCISSTIDSTYWTDINSLTATNAVGDGNVFYAVSNDARTTWSVLDNSNGVRSIARVSGGTWQYNSNETYGSETWVAAASNTEVQALREAAAIASNQMNSTTLNAITDANQITLGNDLDFAAILYMDSGSTVPAYSGTAINYDANILNEVSYDYTIYMPTTSVVRVTAPSSGGPRNARVYISK